MKKLKRFDVVTFEEYTYPDTILVICFIVSEAF